MELKEKIMYGVVIASALTYLFYPKVTSGKEIKTITYRLTAPEITYTPEITYKKGEKLEATTKATLEVFLKQPNKNIKTWATRALGKVSEIDENELLLFPILINQYIQEKDKEKRKVILNSLDFLLENTLEDTSKNQPIKK